MNAAVGKSRCKHLGLPRCSRQKPDDTIESDLDLDELDATSAELKARDQMEWVRLVNGIRNMAEELVLKELV